MKHTCYRCGYSTNDKSNYNKHLKRKRKCPQKTNNISTNQAHNDSQLIEHDSQMTHNSLNTTHKRLTNDSQLIEHDSQIVNNSSSNNTIECKYCHKQFTRTNNKKRHIRLYCKEAKLQRHEDTQLRRRVQELENMLIHQSHITNNNNTIINNNTINLPTTGEWPKMLQRIMVHLISKTRSTPFSSSEVDFEEAFQQTLSMAFFHPESPILNTVEMLGRKESWVKQNGLLVDKNKFLNKVNCEHIERLIKFIHNDNERFRTELPPVPIIEQWIAVNNEVISQIARYDPCKKETIKNTEEVLRNQSLQCDISTAVSEIKDADRNDAHIATSHRIAAAAPVSNLMSLL